jgi:hypothetical protein
VVSFRNRRSDRVSRGGGGRVVVVVGGGGGVVGFRNRWISIGAFRVRDPRRASLDDGDRFRIE